METKTRYTLTASSLGSYFGVGFNNPMEQLYYDMGKGAQEIDAESEERMLLGTLLEDSVLNFFERKLEISITNRNVTVKEGLNGMIRYKVDGSTIYGGEDATVECKVSNSASGVFTKSLGYIIQCQLYMLEEGTNQTILCGLYHGKPIHTIVRRNDELIADIIEMVTEVYSILNGITDELSFPWHLVEKYSNTPKLTMLSELAQDDVDYIAEYVELKQTAKETEARITKIGDYLKSKYENVKWADKDLGLSFSLTNQTRKGFLDEVALTMEYPDLDLDKFRKASSESKFLRITRKG